jgi:CDP-diacylglycerol--serine O-phosphatidyltransferase
MAPRPALAMKNVSTLIALFNMIAPKHWIPGSLTLLNLALGCAGIYLSFSNQSNWIAICLVGAAVLDFFDGFVARLVNATSEWGKQLDSLADVVTFGVLPGFLMLHLLTITCADAGLPSWLAFVSFGIPLLSAARLAKFNIDTRQSDQFIGLPTPANALFFLSLYLFLLPTSGDWDAKLLSLLLIGIILLFSWLLMAEIPLIALKFKTFSWSSNQMRYLLIIGCIGIMILLPFALYGLCIVWYLAISMVSTLLEKKTINPRS